MRRFRRRAAGILSIAALCGLAGCGGPTPVDPPQQAASVGRSPFTADSASPWLSRASGDDVIDANSARYVSRLHQLTPMISVRASTVAVFAADSSTRTFTITPTAPYARPANTLSRIPIPDQVAEVTTDGPVSVVDQREGCVFDLYEPKRTADGWTAEWVNATPVEGSGIYPDGLGTRPSGFSAAAGLIWPEELRAGKIDHGLVFGYPYAREGTFGGLATASGGDATDAAALPMGARLRLDPSIDLDALPLSSEERTIARALQQYGMVLGDTSGNLSFYAPDPRGFAADPYMSMLGGQPYITLTNIPFDRMQVIDLGPTDARYDGPAIDNRCTQGRRS